jgi:hypothetical protein
MTFHRSDSSKRKVDENAQPRTSIAVSVVTIKLETLMNFLPKNERKMPIGMIKPPKMFLVLMKKIVYGLTSYKGQSWSLDTVVM